MIATAPATGQLTIPARFNGPPASANGGYACGAVAGYADGPVEVRLHTPPPLETRLDVTVDGTGGIVVRDGEELVAEARPADLSGLEPPVRPTLAEARQAMRSHPGLGRRHWLSECFVCGPERHDGLGMHAGRLPGWPKLTGALLVADATLPHHDGAITEAVTWAALDCPSFTPEIWDPARPSLLAAMAAEVLEPVGVGEPVVAVGWPLETEGRRHRSASALLGADGRLLARARSLWIRLRGPGEGRL